MKSASGLIRKKRAIPPQNRARQPRHPVTIQLGQALEEVTEIMGPPEKQVLLGAKKIFVYCDLKVVFVDGKVTNAE